MLRLQQYEKLLKLFLREGKVVTYFDLDELPEVVRPNQAGQSTLGVLVQKFLDDVVILRAELDQGADETSGVNSQRMSVTTTFRIAMEPDQRIAIASDLKELVEVRNKLVHSFIDQFDIQSVDGCFAAADSLRLTFELIDARFRELRGFAESLDEARRMAGEFGQSPAFNDIFDGINPDGTVTWQASGIVAALREAAERLGGRKWTRLDDAAAWIAEEYPEQSPKRYGCQSWQQVVHESKVFKVELKIDESGNRIRGYKAVEL